MLQPGSICLMSEFTIARSSPVSEAARPLMEALIQEYDLRYGNLSHRKGGARAEIERYPPHAFSPPFGDFLLIQRAGETIAGGAFMSHDDETAEIKRVWTRDDVRRQGLARRVIAALEESAENLGYTRTYLTTGFRQPEAVMLYLSLGYRPLFDVTADPALYLSLPFEKLIGSRSGQQAETPVQPPASSLEEAVIRVNAVKAEQAHKIQVRLGLHQAAE